MMSRRKLLHSALGAALALCLAAPAQATEDRSYLLATASTGGTFYPVGVAIATLVKVKLQPKEKIGLSAINSAGSAENVKLLSSDEAQFAILQGLYGHYAWNGVGPVTEPQAGLRSISMLWQNVEQFLVKTEHNHTGTIADLGGLKGKAVAMGKKNSGTIGSNRFLLNNLGIDLDQDFGYQDVTDPNTISGTLWDDVNQDGYLDATETVRFANVTMALYEDANNNGLIDAGDTLVATTTTDASATPFPLTVGPDLSFNGYNDAFVAKVNATGPTLDYCGYIGGTGAEYAYGVAVDDAGRPTFYELFTWSDGDAVEAAHQLVGVVHQPRADDADHHDEDRARNEVRKHQQNEAADQRDDGPLFLTVDEEAEPEHPEHDRGNTGQVVHGDPHRPDRYDEYRLVMRDHQGREWPW